MDLLELLFSILRARILRGIEWRARENGKTAFVGLLFDGKEFVLGKEDLLEIANILKTVFEGIDDTEGVIFPLGNREIFMNGGWKRPFFGHWISDKTAVSSLMSYKSCLFPVIAYKTG